MATFIHQVVWDDENTALLLAEGFTQGDIGAILFDRKTQSRLLSDADQSGLGGVTYGVTPDGRSIGVIWESECGNPLHVYPVGVIRDD